MRNKIIFLSLLFISLLNIPTAYAIQDAYGNPISWEGKIKVVNYWAEWCAPCRHEIPAFNQLAKELAEKQILVVGINYDNLNNKRLIRTMENLDIRFPVLDSDSLNELHLPQPAVLPTTYILNADGEIVTSLVGPQTQQNINNTLQKLQLASIPAA